MPKAKKQKLNPEDPNYVKFRYTLPESCTTDDEIKLHITAILQVLHYDEFELATIGYENRNEYGEPLKPHIHVHFITYKDPNTFRDRIRKYLHSIEDTRSGNELYSMKRETDLDYNRFFRYPIKLQHPITAWLRNWCKFNSPEFDYDIQQQLANDEYNRAVIFNLKKREKTVAPSVYDKLETYLTENLPTTPTTTDMIDTSIEFFKSHDQYGVDFAKIAGHVNKYRLIHGYMSKEEARSRVAHYL